MAFDPISRRLFLRGLGTSLALPLLPSLMPKAMAAAAPVRFVAFTNQHGQNHDRWFPSIDPTTKHSEHVYYKTLQEIIAANGSISEFLGPEFNSIQSKLSVLRGLDGTTGPNNVHAGAAALAGSNFVDPYNVGSVPTFPYSIDAIMENSPLIYPSPPKLRALRIGDPVSWNKINGTIQHLSGVNSAQAAFDLLFTGTLPSIPQAPTRRSLVIDKVKEDFNSLMGSRQISSTDKTRLQNYVDLITDLQKKLETPQQTTCSSPALSSLSTTEALYSNYFDVIVAAFACGLTKIATINLSHWGTSQDWAYYHSQSHSNTSNDWKTYSRWRANRVAELMTKLNAVIDLDGRTLLDNSLVLWTNEMGEGSQHQGISFPVLIGGDAGGKIRSGHYIDYRRRPFVMSGNEWVKVPLGRPYNELLVSILQAMGLSPSEYEKDGQQGFGDYSRISGYEQFAGNKRTPLPFFFKS